MSTLLDAPAVRTGRCSLTLSIDGRRYRVAPGDPLPETGARPWRLTVAAGQERAGSTYSVAAFADSAGCTCPDSDRAACKHVRALQALGLIDPQLKSKAIVGWELANLPPLKNRARALRRHKPDLPSPADLAAPNFAAGFRAAVAHHVAALTTRNGGGA